MHLYWIVQACEGSVPTVRRKYRSGRRARGRRLPHLCILRRWIRIRRLLLWRLLRRRLLPPCKTTLRRWTLPREMSFALTVVANHRVATTATETRSAARPASAAPPATAAAAARGRFLLPFEGAHD